MRGPAGSAAAACRRVALTCNQTDRLGTVSRRGQFPIRIVLSRGIRHAKAVLFCFGQRRGAGFRFLAGDERQGRRAERAERAEREEKSDDGERAQRAERREAARQELRERRSARNDDDDAVARPKRAAPSATLERIDEPRSRARLRENGPTVIQERNSNGAEWCETARPASRAGQPIPRTNAPPESTPRGASQSSWRGDWRSERDKTGRNHRRRYRCQAVRLGLYRDSSDGHQPFSTVEDVAELFHRS